MEDGYGRRQDLTEQKTNKNYLKKYLNKAMSKKGEYQISLYWALNMRFSTYSRQLLEKKGEKKKSGYRFLGVFWDWEADDHIPYWYAIIDFDWG